MRGMSVYGCVWGCVWGECGWIFLHMEPQIPCVWCFPVGCMRAEAAGMGYITQYDSKLVRSVALY